MEEMNFHQTPPEAGWPTPPYHPAPSFPTARREQAYAVCMALISLFLCNSILYGGFQLGFAVFGGLAILCPVIYLLKNSHRLTLYTGAMLLLDVLLCAGFARADDGFVKFVILCFLVVGVNIMLSQLSGKNRHCPGGISSLLDAPRTVFVHGVGSIPESLRGLKQASRAGGSRAKKGGAIILGLGISLIVLAIMVPLLIRADAAFDGFIQQLPDFDLGQLILTVLVGGVAWNPLYSMAVSLHYKPKQEFPKTKTGKGVHPLTINTVLLAVTFLYLVYLLSQLAYLWGGMAGILPENFTAAEYARRGFFEMALLCFINLSIISLSVGVVRKQPRIPLLTRILCLFIGIVTVFLTVTSGAKMLLYIGSFGLTRLRVLTQIITVFFGLATAVVCIWLFAPKLPYMKLVLLLALLLGAVTLWADVDTVVARYNVHAYQSGALQTVDMQYLIQLGDGAVPYLLELTQDSDVTVARIAVNELEKRANRLDTSDIRGWTYASSQAKQLLIKNGYCAEPTN